MADLAIRGEDERALDMLHCRAARAGWSVEDEAMAALELVAEPDGETARAGLAELRARVERRAFSGSAEPIRKAREPDRRDGDDGE